MDAAAYSLGSRNQSTVNRSYPAFGLRDWQVSTMNSLARLSGLPENWDSYGSAPIPEQVISFATDLVSGAAFQSAPLPHVVPVSGGGLQLEWSKGLRELEVQITPELTIELFARDGQAMAEQSVQSLSKSNLAQLLNWLDAA